MGLYIIKSKKWGLPEESRYIFDIFEEHNIVSSDLSYNLKKMVGFRNRAVYDYQNLDLNIIRYIINERLEDLETFSKTCLQLQNN